MNVHTSGSSAEDLVQPSGTDLTVRASVSLFCSSSVSDSMHSLNRERTAHIADYTPQLFCRNIQHADWWCQQIFILRPQFHSDDLDFMHSGLILCISQSEHKLKKNELFIKLLISYPGWSNSPSVYVMNDIFIICTVLFDHNSIKLLEHSAVTLMGRAAAGVYWDDTFLTCTDVFLCSS